MTNSSPFSWFDINKYADVEILNLEDWYFQLNKRRVILEFANVNPKLVGLIHRSRWEYVNRNAKKYISSIKNQPIFIPDKGSRPILSVRNSDFFDLRMAYIRSNRLEEVLNTLKSENFNERDEELIISPADYFNPYSRAMLTVDLVATDEQLIKDFREWLKTIRAISKNKVREKKFKPNDLKKWVNYQILPYLDLTLIADAEEIILTQNMLGRMLFPNEYNVDLTERIRKIVKPLAEWLLDSNTLEALHIQSRAERKYS